MHGIGLIGGTFDRFHKGHLHLISQSLEHCNELEIWINSDDLAKKKDPRIQSWEDRHHNIKSSLDEDLQSRVSFGKLEDKFGPASIHEEAQVIFSTENTTKNCEEINKIRIINDLDPLEIVTLELQNAWDGMPISSSRIRAGEIDREGNRWIPESFDSYEMVLTPQVESELKNPFGQLIEGPEEDISIAAQKAISQISQVENFSGPLIAVGDVTVLALQKIGRPADLALIDGKTKRSEWPETSDINFSLFENILECSSPAGTLTKSLLEACKTSISSWMDNNESSLILVTGEEDLAPLLLHPLAPIGSVVLYGQPGKGLVIRWCDEDSKNSCRNLLMGFQIN